MAEQIYGFAMMALIVGALVVADVILRTQHDAHHDAWVEDGCRSGTFWRPPGHAFAAPNPPLSWMIDTPRWAIESPDVIRMLRLLRALWWPAAIGVMVPLLTGLTRCGAAIMNA